MQPAPPPGRARAGAILLTGTLLLAACSGGTPSTMAQSATTPASNPSAPSAAASVAPSEAPHAASTPVPSDGQTAGQERTDPFGLDQVWVPAGTFTMGTDAEAIAALTA